jgi:hypothetical protein
MVGYFLAYQWEAILSEHLLQGLHGSDYLDVVVLLLLTDEAANAWRLAAGHHKHALHLRNDYLDE